MSAVQKIPTTPDAATLDLWRVAENGDVRELAPVLPRVRDINAQNEHGVTALMRAAQFGHLKMVSALLEQGADANIKRNDKFTALALAAFFGHTEIVRALMEHGADLQASTRYDTSPQMWATARTFNEVVDQLDQLEKPAPVEKPRIERPQIEKPQIEKPPIDKPQIGVVHTLKDPPEIWDLVHEVPRGFDARSAFVTRLSSIKTGLAFRLATLAVLIGAGVVGVMVLRGVQARNERSSAAVNAKPPAATMNLHTNPATQNNSQPAAAGNSQSAPANNASSLSSLPPLPPAESDVSVGDQPPVYRKPATRPRYGPHRGEPSLTPPVAAETVQPVAAAPAKPNPEARAESQPKTKENTPLSPQLIAPAKSATPKGKVIQWP